MVDLQAWREHLAEPLRGRRVVLGITPLAGSTALVRQLRADGAQRPLVVASGRGAGEVPTEDEAAQVVLDLPPATELSAQLRAEQALLDDPPPKLVAALDAYDPDCWAVWLGHAWVQRDEVLGRPVFGGRPRRWAALEDKTTCPELFDAAGVPRPPDAVVGLDAEELAAASRRLDRGDGVVWAGDSSAGINGGGELVRRLRDEQETKAALEFFTGRTERLRVSPFLAGVPCSIHGIVLPDGVAVGRPVELVNPLRGNGFLYGGLSTWWDPPATVRSAMQEAVRRVGRHLAEHAGYRGAFGLDGVVTSDGWLPTELNPRLSTGLGMVGMAVSGLPLDALQRALVTGYPAGIRACELEELLLEAADATRTGAARAFSAAVHEPEPVAVAVCGGPNGLRPAAEGDEVVGTLQLGHAAVGAMVRWSPADGTLRAGDRMAPWAVAAFALSDALWGTDFGPLTVPSP